MKKRASEEEQHFISTIHSIDRKIAYLEEHKRWFQRKLGMLSTLEECQETHNDSMTQCSNCNCWKKIRGQCT